MAGRQVGESRLQCVQLDRYCLAGRDEIFHQAPVNIEPAFVFSGVSEIVRFRENSPDLCTQTQRVGKYLEVDVALGWTIAFMPQSGQAKSVRCVVSQVEAAGKGIRRVAGIFQPCESGLFESAEFGCVGRLSGEYRADQSVKG